MKENFENPSPVCNRTTTITLNNWNPVHFILLAPVTPNKSMPARMRLAYRKSL